MKKLLLFTCLLTSSVLLYAEADGPDYWQVRDVSEDDVLNMRDYPDFRSSKIADIPPDARCIRNMGCKGGLTYNEFTTLTEAQKQQILKQRPRWCRVSYAGKVGWVAGRFLTEGVCTEQSGAVTAPAIDVYNHSYSVDRENYGLRNGSARISIPGTTAIIITEIIRQPVYGDLNHDGRNDAAVLLLQHTGGSGSFVYLAAAIDGVSAIESYFLGDRIMVRSLQIKNHVITVDYLKHSTKQPMASPPAVEVSRSFKLLDGKLITLP